MRFPCLKLFYNQITSYDSTIRTCDSKIITYVSIIISYDLLFSALKKHNS